MPDNDQDDYSYSPPRRTRNISDADIEALRGALQEHCRLQALTPADVASFHKISAFLDKDDNMEVLRRISRFVSALESEVVRFIKWLVIGVIILIATLAYNHGYLVKK